MGVTNLWNILAPVKCHTPLSALRGQTVAVDLSIWVCENQCVKSMQGVVSRPYLRNLFFRVSHLTQLGVRLVFVIEGAAPQLKWGEMKRRQQALGRGGTRAGKGGRGNFNSKLRECCQLLDMLGVPYIHSRGEAEAMCAALNAAGLVDACITDDGDAFLYGARTVYRNFTMNNKDPHVESYSMDAIEKDLGISRETLVGVALLLGCDYLPGGVPGVGVDRVIKYLDSIKGIDLLQRFKQWKTMSVAQCVSKIEVLIQQKALAVADFPQRKIISEFLNEQETVPRKSFVWRRPQLVLMQEYAESKMDWVSDYTTEKILPLVTFWELSNPRAKSSQCLQPHRIVKSRVRQGVPVYEVEWNKQGDDMRTSSEFYTTMEDQTLFTRIFPQVVSQWEEEVTAKKNKKKTTSRKIKKTTEEDDLASQLETLNLDQGVTESSSGVVPACTDKKQAGEEVHVKSKRKVNHRKMAADKERERSSRASKSDSNQQPEVDTNIVGFAENQGRQSHRQETAVSRTLKSVSKKQGQQTHQFAAQKTSHSHSESQHLSFGLNDDSCFGQDNTLLSALPEMEKSRHDSPEPRLNEDRSRECPGSGENSAQSVAGPKEEPGHVGADSDKENDDVFLTLTQRLQMKLGQTAKSKSVSSGFEACLALKKTQTVSKSESSFQRRKGRKVRDEVSRESPSDELLTLESESRLDNQMLNKKPEILLSVQEGNCPRKTISNIAETRNIKTSEDIHDNHKATHVIPELKPDMSKTFDAQNYKHTVSNEVADGINQDLSQVSPSMNCKHLSQDSKEHLSLNSNDQHEPDSIISMKPPSILSTSASTHEFTCVADMLTVVDTPEMVRNSAVVGQDETFGLKDLHEDFRAAISELDKREISSRSAGYCNLVNRLKEKLKQPLESRNDLSITSSPGAMNLSTELPHSPSFLCSQTILSGNDDCFLEPEVSVPHQAPAAVRCTRSGSDLGPSTHLPVTAATQPSIKHELSHRTRSATHPQKVSVDTTSCEMSTIVEYSTCVQDKSNLLQASTLLQEQDTVLQGNSKHLDNTALLQESTILQGNSKHLDNTALLQESTILQGNSKLIQDNSLLETSTMLQEDSTMIQQTPSMTHTLTDTTLQFGHFSMQASLLNGSADNTSGVSILGGNATLMTEDREDTTKTVLISGPAHDLKSNRTSILMSETVAGMNHGHGLDNLSETNELFVGGNPSSMLSKAASLRPNGSSAIRSEPSEDLKLGQTSEPTTNPNHYVTSDCEQSSIVIPSSATSSVQDAYQEQCVQEVPVVEDMSRSAETDGHEQSTVVSRSQQANVDVSVHDLNLSLASLSINSTKHFVQSSPALNNLELSGNGSYVFSTVANSQNHCSQNICETGQYKFGNDLTTPIGAKDSRYKSNRRSKLSLRKSSSNLSLEKGSVGIDLSLVSNRPAESPSGRTCKKENHPDRTSPSTDSRTDVALISEGPAELHSSERADDIEKRPYCSPTDSRLVATLSEGPSQNLPSDQVNSKGDNFEIHPSSSLTVSTQPEVIDLTDSPITAEAPETKTVIEQNSSTTHMSRNIFRNPNAKVPNPKPKTRIKSWTSKKQALFRLLEELSDSDADSEMDGFSQTQTQTSKLNQLTGIPTNRPSSRNEYRTTAEDFNTLGRQGYISSLQPLDNSVDTCVANQNKGNVECQTRKNLTNNSVQNYGTNSGPCSLNTVDNKSKARMTSTRNGGNSIVVSNSSSKLPLTNSTSSNSVTSASSNLSSSNSPSSSKFSLSNSVSASNSTLSSSSSTSNSSSSRTAASTTSSNDETAATNCILDTTSRKHKRSVAGSVCEDSFLNTTAHESPISLTDRLRSRLSNNARAALKNLSSQRKVLSSVNIKPINK